MTRIHLIRHGQASFGTDDYDQLSEKGLQQSRLLGKARYANGCTAISGTLRRHLQTAVASLSEQSHSRNIIQNPDWNEFNYLDIIKAYRPDLSTHDALVQEFTQERNPNKAFQKLYDASLLRWSSGAHDGDYTESRSAFRNRIRAALQYAKDNAPKDDCICVFTSGGPISAVVQDALNLTEDATRQIERMMVNTAVTTLSMRGDTPRLITLNEYAHLKYHEEDYVTYR